MPDNKPYGGLPPTETYKGVPIFLYQDDDMPRWQWGAMVGWHGRMVPAQVEEWEKPTQANIMKAARSVIDVIKSVEAEGLTGPDGYLKTEGKEGPGHAGQ